MTDFPTIYFKYHDKNIDQSTYDYENNLINIATNNNITKFKNSDFYYYNLYNSDIIVNSNLYSDEPKILSAGGFSFLQSALLMNKNNVEEVQGNWNTSFDIEQVPLRAITTSGDPRGYYSTTFPTLATKFDNMPICFSFPILPSSVEPSQFLLTLSNGLVTKPITFTFSPNTKLNEKQCIVICGYFNNKITTGPNAIYPVSLEIVESPKSGKRMMAIGPNGLYDMTGKTVQCSNPYSEPLEIASVILTKYNLPNIYNYLGDVGCGINNIEENNSGLVLYSTEAQYRFRIFTKGGYSPNGIVSMFPDQYDNYFYLQHKDKLTGIVTDLKKSNHKYCFFKGYVEIIGLADLGLKQNSYNDTYIEDHDNQIDIIVKGDESVIVDIVSLVIPSQNSYTKFYNPGGPGPTPFDNIIYTNPSEYQVVNIINNLENPKTVSWINLDQRPII